MSEQARREQLARKLLDSAYADLTPVQRSVVDLVAREAPTGRGPRLRDEEASLGQQLADRVAALGGSWGFIGGFSLCLAVWAGWNLVFRGSELAFDPYPFIFLNLLLSTLAALQAPVIMMSQNRQSERDRQAAEHDYEVNLRAELEIMLLHDKLDSLRSREVVDLLKAQNETLELLRARLA
ncbi:DUF1003 domain-containing protein [Phenylobacterium sp.]|uniref:DUF1003 domain-containing protein n=1 Tax=Phenylobacterium sp. TaxID=1871053 RepID=UPI0019A6FD30|nr:DUF1003 domain-containing protein [Phenylobacterium sp.]MBC7167949.1 DUF1003 domain-containing protein [Phenylobacterium sp.]